MSVFSNIYKSKVEEMNKEIISSNAKSRMSVDLQFYFHVVNMFKWNNVPKASLPYLPEQFLCNAGRIALFEDEKELLLYPAFPNGTLLENGEYSEYTMIAKNGKTWIRKREDIALCNNNSLYLPSYVLIDEFAEKTTFSLEAVDTALRRATHPHIILARNEEEMIKIQNALSTSNNKLATVTMAESFDDKEAKILKYFDNKENDILALWDVYIRYRNSFYTAFGSKTVEIQKKERLTEAEGTSNEDIVFYSLLQDMWDRRSLDFTKEAIEKFNHDPQIEMNRSANTVFELMRTNEEKLKDQRIEVTKGANITKVEEGGGCDEL